MPINRAQIQKGLLWAGFLTQCDREAQCEVVLEALSWPDGFRCLGCGGARHTVFERAG